MLTRIVTNRTEIDDFVRGVTFMGTGGGGRPDAGGELLYGHLGKNDVLGRIDLGELADVWACCAFTMGSNAPHPPHFKEDQHSQEYGVRGAVSALPRAIRTLEKCARCKISVVFPPELGGINTPGPGHAAAVAIGRLDAQLGRGVPEATQVTPTLCNISMWPSSICDEWGNALILLKATSLAVAEAIGKGVSIIANTQIPTRSVAWPATSTALSSTTR